MEFFIKQNSTLPYLKLKVFKDGRTDFRKFADELTTSTITFSMYDEATEIYKILNRPALIMSNDDVVPEYYVYYSFRKIDTKKIGRYIGEFKITNNQGEIILPLPEILYVNINSSFANSDTCCRPNRGERTIISPTQTPRPSSTPL